MSQMTDLTALRERYSPKPEPKCRICGAEMTIQRMSASRITYGCTGVTYDDKGCHYAAGRSIADVHYAQSRVTVVDVSDPEVLALLDELEALQSFRTAFNEWHDKTEWVQGDKRFDVIKPWGKHRADVLKLYIDHLESKLEAAEKQNALDVQIKARLCRESNSLHDRLREAEKRITELEARQGVMRSLCNHQLYWDVSNVQRCAICGVSISSADGKGAAQ